MNKELKVTLKVDAKTGEITAVKNSFDTADRSVKKTNDRLDTFKSKLLAAAGVTTAIYGLGKAIGFVVESGFDYNKSMDASTAKLTAMISAAKGYETVGGEQVSVMQRQKLIAAEVSDMMDILKTTNAQTAMGMSELVDIYALAKSGMDKYKWSVKDQIEIVKLASNTASNFGMTAEELSSGIDDLAAGTWETSSGFGKMMKALGVSKEEFKATGDKVAYLKKKMKETGAAQDTWAVAVSNFRVAWDNMAGQVTQPIFDGVEEAIKHITDQMNIAGPHAMQVFSDALVDMVNGGISAIGTLIGWISKMVSGFKIAYQGYVKLYALANGGTLHNVSKLKSEVADLNAELNKENPYPGINPFSTFREKSKVVKDLIVKTRELQDAESALEDRRKADKALEGIAEFDAKMQNIAQTVKNITIKKGSIDSIKEAVPPTQQLAYKINAVSDANTKKTKSDKKAGAAAKEHAKELRSAAKASDDLYRKYLELTGQQKKLFNLDAEKTLKEFMNAGYSGEQLSQIYNAMWDKYIDKGKDANKDIAEDFAQHFKDMATNIFTGVTDSLRNGGSINQALAESDIGVQFADGLKSSGNPYAQAAGYAIEFIGALFSNFVSQAEIDAATGRVDFTDDSIRNMGSMFENVMNPQLKETHTIARLTGQLNDKFSLIARAITGTLVGTGVDLTGVDYTPTAKYGFAGFSSKTIDILGTGLDFSGTLSSLDVQGYISELIKKSSWWGLSKSSKINIRNIDLPTEAIQAINDVMSDGIESILVAGTKLGFDADAMKARLEAYVPDIGKVNLMDLSASEVQEKLASVFSEIFSGAIGSLDTSITTLINTRSKAGEENLATLVRLATEYEQASYAMKSISHVWTDSVNNVLDIVNNLGGLDAFNEAYTSYIGSFYTAQEQYDLQLKNMLYTFDMLDVAMPETLSGFRELVDMANATGDTDLYTNLLSINQQFYEMVTASESLNSSLVSLKKNTLKQLRDLSMTDSATSLNSIVNYANRGDYTGIQDAYTALIDTAKSESLTRTGYMLSIARANDYIQNINTNPNKGVEEKLVLLMNKVEDLTIQNKDLQDQIAANTSKIATNTSTTTIVRAP